MMTAVPPSFIGDNVQQPGMQSQVYVPDQLIVDAKNLVTQSIVLATGVLKRGTVLGQQSNNPITAQPGASNVGNGTITNLNVTDAPQLGQFQVLATTSATFNVFDPTRAIVGTASVGIAFTGGGISFLITAGSTPYAAGDSFIVTVTDSVGAFVVCVKGASDGSQNPTGILVDDADASAGPVLAGAYVAGEFNANAIIVDASWSIPEITQAARAYSIFIKRVVSAAPPSNNAAP